jgi:polyhydroxyalkanoate synthesis regulator phasin
MAKKAKKDKGAASRTEQLRAAVEGAFGATAHGAAPVGKRAQELADELVGVATRLREALGSEDLARLRGTEPAAAAAKVREAVEGLRPPSTEQVDALRAQVAALEARVAALEAAAKPAPAPRRRAPARKPAGAAAKGATRTTKPAARDSADGPAARTTAARRTPGGGARKPAGGQDA